MIVVATPMDKEIAELRGTVAGTRWAYGDPTAPFAKSMEMERGMACAPAPTAAARGSFMLKKEAVTKARYEAAEPDAIDKLAADASSGAADLLEALEYKALKLDDLEEEKLPEELRKLTKEERVAYVEKALAERKELEKKLAELSRKRDEYVAAERQKNADKKDGFDEQVGKFIREQAKKKGIVYGD